MHKLSTPPPPPPLPLYAKQPGLLGVADPVITSLFCFISIVFIFSSMVSFLLFSLHHFSPLSGQFLSYTRIRQSKRDLSTEDRTRLLSYAVEEDLCQLELVRLSNPTRTSSQKKNVIDATRRTSRIAQSETSFNPSHRPSHHKSTKAHTPISGTIQQYHTSAPTLAWLLSLLLLLAARKHDKSLAPPASSVYIIRWQQHAVWVTLCQQRLRLLQLWRLSSATPRTQF